MWWPHQANWPGAGGLWYRLQVRFWSFYGFWRNSRLVTLNSGMLKSLVHLPVRHGDMANLSVRTARTSGEALLVRFFDEFFTESSRFLTFFEHFAVSNIFVLLIRFSSVPGIQPRVLQMCLAGDSDFSWRNRKDKNSTTSIQDTPVSLLSILRGLWAWPVCLATS